MRIRTSSMGIALILIVALLAGQLGWPARPAAAAAAGAPSSWAKAEIDAAIASGLIPYGLTNSYQLALTRQEFSDMAVQLYEVLTDQEAPAPGANPFKDTSSAGVLRAYALGIVKGTGAHTFSPKATVTREQIALMLYNTLAKAGFRDELASGAAGTAPVFADAKQLADWSRGAVGLLAASGVMKGDGTGPYARFLPKQTTTREQSIVLVYRIFERFGSYFVRGEADLLGAPLQAKPVVIKDERAGIVDKKAREILAEIVEPGMTEYERELAIHDYILLHAAYDYDNYRKDTVPADSYTMYGLLVDGVAVCQGYAYTAQLLLRMAGIEAYYVRGTAGGGAHAWNKVKIDGSYYNLDVTWDDPVPDLEGRVAYGYFNVTDAELRRDHVWTDKLPKATAQAYNYYVYNGLVADTPAAFEARVDAAIEAGEETITLKRTYDDPNGEDFWNAMITKHGNVRSYAYTLDNSGVVTFRFAYA
ncbi:transglutaminase domain-containing protein [Paenibacillus sp. UNC496MF]|uniref:transglutaminase domain-containing protein n=1 Tax=Paenibacillus sp. UNC496MF TaxID=1502753 RepID=UPI001C42EC56|nr:S-layer homology domain-containing protein [Paenibacillus sp. UNC496MF]